MRIYAGNSIQLEKPMTFRCSETGFPIGARSEIFLGGGGRGSGWGAIVTVTDA